MNRLFTILFLVFAFTSCEKEKKHFAYVYGHGGTSLYPDRYIHPPNSMESVEYALDVLDADGIEIDVQLTKDSVLVCYHDAHLEAYTNAFGCINDQNWEDIKDLNYTSKKYRIPLLKDVMQFCLNRHKKIHLDIRSLNQCSGNFISTSGFNYALNNCLNGWDEEFKSNVTANARDIHILLDIEDTIIKKSFETEDIDLGLLYIENNGIDMLCIKASAISETNAELLYDLGIQWSVYGIKTQKEIRNAHGLRPTEMISDNIPYAKKLSN